MSSYVLCPRCKRHSYTPYAERFDPKTDPYPPALSRLSRGPNDAPLWICSECGQDEAMIEFTGQKLQPPGEWPVEIQYTFVKVPDSTPRD